MAIIAGAQFVKNLIDKKKDEEEAFGLPPNLKSAFLNYKKSQFKGSGYIVSLIFSFIAVFIAVRCNPTKKIGYGILSFIFSEIYLLQFIIRKYAIKSPTYCLGFRIKPAPKILF